MYVYVRVCKCCALAPAQTFMKDFLHLEMLFHAKVLDFYTAAYKSIDDMHPDIDFAVLYC